VAGARGGLTTQAPQAVAWAGSPAAMEGKARAQCTEASSTWHEHRRGDHTVFSPRLSSVPGSATGRGLGEVPMAGRTEGAGELEARV
jgi:hypothetical protein